MIGLYVGGRTEPIELPLSEFLDVIAKAAAGLVERE
jgi:hypothetical protein